MSELTCKEYWTEINSIASEMVRETMEENDNDREAAEEVINDTRLHETIDGHQWVIYYGYNLEVIKQSDNDDYYADNFGNESLAASLEQGGINTLHCHMAFWAMYADVQDKLDNAFDEYKESSEAA